ncbi:MAG TPA: hypothetical protein PLL09_05760 [Flavobacterium sp.]|uniref:hypothetical protein n=1 Tax=unclassified Flavobacterium TaxID=196869 RepID=UPI0025C6ED89|nr:MULTISPECIES: hypothetical protein [unclassified Flavobacterium]HRE77314.1 hypothetical protein [Flavobacterium sp.]
MKNLLFLVIFTCNLSYAQKMPVAYQHGQNSMELIAKTKTGTVVVSTFNAKMTIRQDIAQKIFSLYQQNKIKHNAVVTVLGKEAKVVGKCFIKKKHNLTSIEFYYDKVFWHNGMVEVHGK